VHDDAGVGDDADARSSSSCARARRAAASSSSRAGTSRACGVELPRAPNAVSVVAIRSGRRRVLARACARTGGESCGGVAATALAAFVNARGQAAAALTTDGGTTVTLVAFTASGRRRDLDAGPAADVPAAALTLRNSTVSWTHDGQPRRATIG